MEIHNKFRFYLARLRECLWLKPLVSCVLSIVAALCAGLAEHVEMARSFPVVSAESVETLLGIMSSSMLVIAVFAVGAMLSAYASASNTATPRTFPLVVGDDISQNALSTFVGAFIFSIVAQVAALNDYYGQAGNFVLFLMTILVFAIVILNFVRWVDRIARLGRLGNTIQKVEAVTDSALQMHAKSPTLGAARAGADCEGSPVYPDSVGYVQNIDVASLQDLAKEANATICVKALPGTFVTPQSPLAFVDFEESEVDRNLADFADAFVVSDSRTFESDPRFGLVVLSEIASRALSPAVNDAGTAIGIIGTLVRLLVRWSRACDDQDDPSTRYDRISIPPISLDDMFEDAFRAIARDGAGYIEVNLRLQKGFQSLALAGGEEMQQAVARHSRQALKYAEKALQLPEEINAVRALAEQAGSKEDDNAGHRQS